MEPNPSTTTHKQEGHHKHRGAKGSEPTLNTPRPQDLHWEGEYP